MKHTILFVAANPLGTDQRALDREARAIQAELERSGFRDCFELVTRWAAEPLDLLRELRRLKPAVVHFGGHGSPAGPETRNPAEALQGEPVPCSLTNGASQQGLLFQGADGRPRFVSSEAIEQAFDSVGSSVKLVVLDACYSEPQAAALLTRVDCVVGMRGTIGDDAARSFAIGFYGGLGDGESVAAAYKQGCAAIHLEGLPHADRPQLNTRPGVDAAHVVLGAAQASRLGADDSWEQARDRVRNYLRRYQRTFAWARKWEPRSNSVRSESSTNLAIRGLRATTWAAIEAQRCLVLLGELGSGKSTELAHAISRSLELGRRVELIDLTASRLAPETLVQRIHSDEPGDLFLDALDQEPDARSRRALAEWLEIKLPKNWRLRLTCRVADWSDALEHQLRRTLGDELAVYHLLQLSRDDLALAARQTGIEDPNRFLNDIVARDLESLAMQPLTLKMLLDVAKGSPEEALPDSSVELFERATLGLECDPDEFRAEQQKHSPELLLAVARLISAASILCNRPVISANKCAPASGNKLSLLDLLGVSVRVAASTISVDSDLLRAAVRTSLFTALEAGEFACCHRTIGEFLAAQWICQNVTSLTVEKIEELLFYRDARTRMVLQLQGVATWLASMNPLVLDVVLEREPELFLADVPTDLSFSARAAIVDKMLRDADWEAAMLELDRAPPYARLRHPGLAAQLRPIILDRARSGSSRSVAIAIAQSCGLVELEDDLVAIAIDTSDNGNARQSATIAFGTIGSEGARGKLQPIFDELGPNPHVVLALWPEHTTRDVLFESLWDARKSCKFSAFEQFLTNSQRLTHEGRIETIVAMLDWGRDGEGHALRLVTDLEQAQSRFLELVLDQATLLLVDDRVVIAFVRYAASSLTASRSDNRPVPRGWPTFITDPRSGHDSPPTARFPGDLRSFLERLDTETSADVRYWIIQAIVCAATLSKENYLYAIDRDLVFSASGRHSDLDEAVNITIDPDELRATHEKSHWGLPASHVEEMIRRLGSGPVSIFRRSEVHREVLCLPVAPDRIHGALCNIDTIGAEAYKTLDLELERPFGPTASGTEDRHPFCWDNDRRISAARLWIAADAETKVRIVQAAKRYLLAFERASGDFHDDDPRDRWTLYRALVLLMDVESGWLEAQETTRWTAWVAAIIPPSLPDTNEDGPVARLAYSRAPEAVIERLLEYLVDRDAHDKPTYLDFMLGDIWDPRLASCLQKIVSDGCVRSHKLRTESRNSLLMTLSYHEGRRGAGGDGLRVSRSSVRRVFTRAVRHAGWFTLRRILWPVLGRLLRPILRRLSRSASVRDFRARFGWLLARRLLESPTATWPLLKELLLVDPKFAHDVFDRIDETPEPIPTRALSERDACDLFLALHDSLPAAPALSRHEREERAMSILGDLIMRGTIEARNSLRKALEHIGRGHRISPRLVRQFEALALAASWVPLSPSDVLRRVGAGSRSSARLC